MMVCILQELNVTVSTKLSPSEINLLAEDSKEMSKVGFVDSSEWYLHTSSEYQVHNPPQARQKTKENSDDGFDDEEDEGNIKLPRASVNRWVKATRRPQFYVFNIIVLMV